MADDRHPDSKQADGNAKQHDDEQGGGGGSAGGGGKTKHAEGTKSEHSGDRTGSGTHDSSRESNNRKAGD